MKIMGSRRSIVDKKHLAEHSCNDILCELCNPPKEQRILDIPQFKEEDANKSATGSLRYNNGKPEMSQLDPRFIMELAKLMTQSEKKYGKYNWALGQKYTTTYDSLNRHMTAFLTGEEIDPESGIHHLIHCASNIMIMWTSWKLDNPELDDRYFKEKK